MHLSDTELKLMLNEAAKAMETTKNVEATKGKDVCEFFNQITDSQITLALLLAIVLVILQGVLGYLWIGFFIITHSLMAIASAFLAVMWISNRADKRAREMVKSQMKNN